MRIIALFSPWVSPSDEVSLPIGFSLTEGTYNNVLMLEVFAVGVVFDLTLFKVVLGHVFSTRVFFFWSLIEVLLAVVGLCSSLKSLSLMVLLHVDLIKLGMILNACIKM